MRHYFGYTITGELVTIEVYGPAGWPAGKCLANPDCNADAVTSLKASRAIKNPEVVGFIPYDCPCDGATKLIKDCKCIGRKFANSYVDVVNKTLVEKPARTVQVDGEAVEDKAVLLRPPGTILNLKVVAPGIPDGQTATFIQRGSVNLLDADELTLTFTGGESNTVTLLTPPAGLRGDLWLGGRMVRPFSMGVRGSTGV